MAENTKIEWTDHTFNPWVGCTKIAPPCDHCYAESWAKRTGHPELWQGERRRTSEQNWRKPITWHNQAPEFMRDNDRLQRVFCASLADVFDNQVPKIWRSDLFALIEDTPRLDWLLLTKRPQNIRKMIWPKWDCGLPRNIWLGITCGDQQEFDRNWPVLADIPACVRFISHEPSLGPLRLYKTPEVPLPFPHPDWIICGGESGPHARMMQTNWARDLRDDCTHLGVKFFLKQMTTKAPIPPDLMIREFPR